MPINTVDTANKTPTTIDAFVRTQAATAIVIMSEMKK